MLVLFLVNQRYSSTRSVELKQCATAAQVSSSAHVVCVSLPSRHATHCRTDTRISPHSFPPCLQYPPPSPVSVKVPPSLSHILTPCLGLCIFHHPPYPTSALPLSGPNPLLHMPLYLPPSLSLPPFPNPSPAPPPRFLATTTATNPILQALKPEPTHNVVVAITRPPAP